MDKSPDMKRSAVVLQKPSATIAVNVDVNAIQRKFYNALLYFARKALRKNKTKVSFKVSLSDLKNALDISERDKNNKYYIEKVEELTNKKARYNVLGKDKTVWGVFVLVSSVKFVRDRSSGTVDVEFEFPDFVRRALLDPQGIYANIDLIVIRGLKSKYSIILYELVKDYVRGSSEVPEMSIEKFRELFGLKEKYKIAPMLRRRVLDVAVNELNNNDEINFVVSYELKKVGRAYNSIKFRVRPKPEKVQKKSEMMGLDEVERRDELRELLFMLPEECRRREKVVSVILGGLEEYDFDYVKAQVEYVVDVLGKQKINNLPGYLKKAIEEDYAGVNELEIDVIGDSWRSKLIGKVVTLRGESGGYEIVVVGETDEYGRCLVRLDNTDTGETIWRKIPEDKLRSLAEVGK